IFCHLAAISEMVLHVYFVFNRPDHAWFKEGKGPGIVLHMLMQCFQELLTLFGFGWHVVSLRYIYFHVSYHSITLAPAEAEAELTQLDVQGHVNVVITHDGDALLFGVTSVITPGSHSVDNVEIYTADTIKHGANLTQGGLLLIVLIKGGNYGVSTELDWGICTF
ncbi:hypothetical protein V8B97DRAFT_1870158, partial [Scleroderma yunnanense]